MKLSVFAVVVSLALVCMSVQENIGSSNDNSRVNILDIFDAFPLMRSVARTLVNNPALVENFFVELGMPGAAKLYRKKFNGYSSTSCILCQNSVRLLKMVADSIDGYESVRGVVHSTCKTVVRTASPKSDEDILCPSVMDLYGPHVVYILKTGPSKNFGYRFCENFNICYVTSPYNSAPTYQSVPELTPEVAVKNDPLTSEAALQHQAAPGFAEHFAEAAGRQRRDTAQSDDVIRIAHLADIHIDPLYATGAATDCGLPACCRDEFNGTGSAGNFGSFGCNIPQRTIDRFLTKIAEMDPKPDFVIYTGDNPPHQMFNNETVESQLSCSRLVMESFRDSLVSAGLTIFPLIGNHETSPTNLYYTHIEETKELQAQLLEWWSPLMNLSQDARDTISAGSYFTLPTGVPGLRVLTINTNYWYLMNFYNVLSKESTEVKDMRAFVVDTLSKARADGEKVIMALHHPPGGADVIVDHGQWYSDVIQRFHDVIVLQIAGHTHKDHFHMFTSKDEKTPIGSLFVTPTVTSRRSGGGSNPSMRMYSLNRTSLELLNYEQYRMYLYNQNGTFDNDPSISLVYTAREEYNLTDMSPSSIQDFTDRLAANSSLFQTWFTNYLTDADVYECDDKCQHKEICSLRYPSYDLVLECMATYEPPAAELPTQETWTTEVMTTDTWKDVTTQGDYVIVTTEGDEGNSSPVFLPNISLTIFMYLLVKYLF